MFLDVHEGLVVEILNLVDSGLQPSVIKDRKRVFGGVRGHGGSRGQEDCGKVEAAAMLLPHPYMRPPPFFARVRYDRAWNERT